MVPLKLAQRCGPEQEVKPRRRGVSSQRDDGKEAIDDELTRYGMSERERERMLRLRGSSVGRLAELYA